MSDDFQVITVPDVSLQEAELLAPKIIEWLVERGIIEKTTRDCVLSRDGVGYPPGPNYWQAVGSLEGYHTTRLRTNGLGVIIERTVFHSGEGGVALICVRCGSNFEGEETWSQAVGEWYDGNDRALFACPKCGHTKPLIEWEHEPTWAFGNLGFEFWNWPRLKESFISEVSERLGHRAVLVWGSL